MTGGARRSGRVGGQSRWVTLRGELSGREVDAACARLGVPGGRERRRRWQSCGLFPLPASTTHRGGGGGGAYHPEAASLAAYVHALTELDAEASRTTATIRAHEAIRRLRLRANDHGSSPVAEDRFYVAVRAARASLIPPAAPFRTVEDERRVRRAAESSGRRPPRWVTIAGSISARELEEQAATHGVRLDRARRTYWQAERVFPQPERRLIRPPEGSGGARGYYHPGATDLARIIDYIVSPGHPAKAQEWRCSVRELSGTIGRWREEADAAAGGHGARSERVFYERVAGLVGHAEAGLPIPGLEPSHRDVLPDGQRRVASAQAGSAIDATARVTQAIADEWVSSHPGDPAPDRLVVWFRLERSGPGDWRIADAGARRTSHDSTRARGLG